MEYRERIRKMEAENQRAIQEAERRRGYDELDDVNGIKIVSSPDPKGM